MKILAEETTTLPEGAQISVCRGQYEGSKVRSQFTELVAMHAGCPNKRIQMRMDNIPAHLLKTYLMLTVREINRERAKVTVKPPEPYRKPQTIRDFVQWMAHFGMFILQPWNEATNTETVLEGSKQVPDKASSAGSSTVDDNIREDGSGTKRRSGKAETNRRRRKQRDVGVQPDAVRKVRKATRRPAQAGGRAEGISEVVDEHKPGSGSDPAGSPVRGVCESGGSGEEAADVGLSEEPPEP